MREGGSSTKLNSAKSATDTPTTRQREKVGGKRRNMNRSGVCWSDNVWLPTSTAGGVRSMDRAILKHHNAR